MGCRFGFKCSHEGTSFCSNCTADKVFKAIERAPFSLRRTYG